MPKWITEVRSGFGAKIFLPVGMNRSGWIEVSAVGDAWAVYFDPASGTTIRCEDFFRQALAEAGLPQSS